MKLVIGQFVVENRESRAIGHGRLLCLLIRHAPDEPAERRER